MTKSSISKDVARETYCVCFMESCCYRIRLRACSEEHAIALAKRRWYHGDNGKFQPYSGETDGWDAICEPEDRHW